jgi:hypothetical protein
MSARTECPNCGSSDGLATYDNGTYCWSCRHTTSSLKVPLSGLETKKKKYLVRMPHDLEPVGMYTPKEEMDWIEQYALTSIEIESYIRYSPSFKRLIFATNRFDFDQDAEFVARSVREEPRYISKTKQFGIVRAPKDSDTYVLVEDNISSIKVGRYANTIALLCKNITLTPVICNMFTAADNVFVWLDKDAEKDSRILSGRLRNLFGDKVKSIVTDKDPKCYNDSQLQMILENTQ